MFKKGDKVIKILSGAGFETGMIREVQKVSKKKNMAFLDADDANEKSPQAYDLETGYAINSYVSGFSSRIIPLGT